MHHDYDYTVPLANKTTDIRELDISGIGFLGQTRWFSMNWLDIYSGVNLSLFQVSDYGSGRVLSKDLNDTTTAFLVPVFGLQTTPRKAISLFVEARYLYQLGDEITRKKIEQIDVFGNAKVVEKMLDLNMLLIGAGLRWNF